MAGESRPILIVVGTSIRAEEADRPLAYYLKQQIERTPKAPRVIVVADLRWLHDEPLQSFPSISLGGPGVNALAHRWIEDLPVTLAVDDQFYIQMPPKLETLRASLWGMNNSQTQLAVSTFVQRFLPRFLERSAEID